MATATMDECRSGPLAVLPTAPLARELAAPRGSRLVGCGSTAWIVSPDRQVIRISVRRRQMHVECAGRGRWLGGDPPVLLMEPGELWFPAGNLPPLPIAAEPIAAGYDASTALLFTDQWSLQVVRLSGGGGGSSGGGAWTRPRTVFPGERFMCRLSVLRPGPDAWHMASATGLWSCSASAEDRTLVRSAFKSPLRQDPTAIYRMGSRPSCAVCVSPGAMVRMTEVAPLSYEGGEPLKRSVAWTDLMDGQLFVQEAGGDGLPAPRCLLIGGGEDGREVEGYGAGHGGSDLLYVWSAEEGLRCCSLHRVVRHPQETLWRVELDDPGSPLLGMAVVGGVLLLLFEGQLVSVGQRT